MDFITQNYEAVLQAIGALVTAASAIVALTPSTRDDAIVGRIVEFISKFSVFNRKVK